MQYFFRKLLFLIILQHLTSLSLSAKILILHPLYSGSHVLTLRSVAEALTERGHEVQIIRWKDSHIFPTQNNQNITVTTLAMDNSLGHLPYLTKEKEAAFQVPFDILWNSGLSFKAIIETYRAFPLMGKQCDTLLENKKLIKEIREMDFDLAIIDILYNECGLALLNHLRIPVVGYWAFPFASGEADYTTAFLPPSHVPTFLSKLGEKMSFIARFYNLLMKIGSHLCMWIHCTIVNKSIQRNFPMSPHPFRLLKELNGMLINTDYVLDYPRLLPPTFLNVGGMQIRPVKPLPKDIEDWIQSSGDDGVILFTMGFIFNPKIVPKSLVNAFMEAFSRFPQKFIVKFEGPLDFIPSNVKVLDFVPQQDVLAHPKTRAFITHCGLHGVMESIYYKVPMVGMPIFIDQGDVLVKMKEKEIAVGINKETSTADDIEDALLKILKNPKYKRNIEKLSHLMRDVDVTPLERVLNFLEYLIRHKGAEHLKIGSRHLNSVQYFCLDTIGFLILLIIGFTHLTIILAKFLVRKFVYRRIKSKFNSSRGQDNAQNIIKNNEKLSTEDLYKFKNNKNKVNSSSSSSKSSNNNSVEKLGSFSKNITEFCLNSSTSNKPLLSRRYSEEKKRD